MEASIQIQAPREVNPMDHITVKRFKIVKIRQREDFEPYDIYSDVGLDENCDNDEVSCAEEGFMRGYLSA